MMTVAFHSSAFAQNSKKYESRTLAQIVSLNKTSADQVLSKAKSGELRDFIGLDPLSSKVRVQFESGPRQISDSHKQMIEWWVKLQRVDKKVLQQYEKEFLFTENGIEYWIPVQTQFVDEMSAKFKQGDPITLLVLYVGARKEKNETTYNSLFLSTGFGS